MSEKADIITIIIADDHEIFRDGFAVMIRKSPEIKLVAEARNGVQLVSLAGMHRPDVVLVDVEMPDMDGIEATSRLKELFPEIGVIGLSSHDSDHLVMDMIRAGAKGYLLKNAHKQEIREAICAVARDEPYYCSRISHKLARFIAGSRLDIATESQKALFSPREVEIMRLICQEYSNKEISEQLYLSIRTVEGYRLRILEKTEARNTAGVVVYAIRKGIFKL